MKKRTIQDQIKDLENTLAAKSAEMRGIADKAMEEGRSMDDEEASQFDGLTTEVKRLNADIGRLRTMQELEAASAVDVDGASAGSAAVSRGAAGGGGGGTTVIVRRSNDVDEKFKGQNFTRGVIARALSEIDQYRRSPSVIAQQRWGKTNPTLVAIIKANEVAGGGTGSGEWGAELVTADNRYTGDFIEYLYSQTVFDQLAFREVPANVTIKGQDGAATGYWVGESKAIPATTADFSSVTLSPLKVAALAVVSNELLRDSSPAAEVLVRDALVEASAQRVDTTLLSSTAASAGVSPAGLLNGVSGTASEGPSADGARQDIYNLIATFNTAKLRGDIVLVTSRAVATQLGLMFNALGQPEFPGLSRSGGSMLGYRVIVGDNVTAGNLIAIAEKEIYKIGDLGVQVSISRDATIEQNTSPTGATDTPVAASATITSMFQEESTAIKVVRPINFAKRRSTAVALVTGAGYYGDYNG